MAGAASSEEAASLLEEQLVDNARKHFGREDDASIAPAQAPEVESMEEPRVPEVFTLVREGSFQQAIKILEVSPEKWADKDDEGHSLLHWGALAGDVEFVQIALAAGIPADVRSANGQTPFMWTVIRGHIDTARVLLKADADPRAQDSLGATPMILAVQYRKHSILLLLMVRVPPAQLLNVADAKGCTPVHWAAYKGDIATLRLLGYFEANFSTNDNEGMTPLHRSVQARAAKRGGGHSEGDRQVMEFLLEREVNPMLRDNEGRTCLTIAEDNKDLHIAYVLRKLLVKSGYDPAGLEKANPDAVAIGVSDVKDIEAGESSKTSRTKKAKEQKEKDFLNEMRGKAIQFMAPTFWLVSVSLAVFQYLTDMRSTSWELSPAFSLAFELGIPLSLALFFYTCLTDPGKVPPAIKSKSGVEELMRALDTAAVGSGDQLVDSAGRRLNFNRLCTTTFILKGLRTKYCTQTGACVEEFDHFCGWLNVAIGKGNHRPFIGLAFVEACTQACHLYLMIQISFHVVVYERIGQWLSSLLISYPLLCMMIFLQGLTAPGVFLLMVNHLRLIMINMTTNEVMNCQRYEHFWEETGGDDGGPKRKVFVNPFDKGGGVSNCLDFWWTRRRGIEGSQA